MKNLGAISCLSLLLLSACQDPDFGDKAKEFVDTRVHDLSLTSATSLLKSSWYMTMQKGMLSAVARNEYVMENAQHALLPKVSPELTLDQALEVVQQADEGIVTLIGLEQDTAETNRRLDSLLKACDSRELFDNFDLGNLSLRLTQNLVVPNRPDLPGSMFFLDPISTIAANASSIYTYDRLSDQIDIALQALASIPSKVTPPDAMFEISKGECRSLLDTFWKDIFQVQSATSSLDEALRLKSKAMLSIRRVAEKKIASARIQDAAASSGYAKLVAQINASNFQASLTTGLVEANEEIRSLRKAVNNSRDCYSRLYALENFQDAMAELTAALEQLDSSAPVDDLGRRIHDAHQKMAAGSADLKSKFKAMRNEACQ